MKLRKSNLRIFYVLTAFLISLSAVLTTLSCFSYNSYAEDLEDSPSDTHYVTIHDSGKTLTVKTDSATVGELMERLKYEIDPADIVDPGLATEMDSLNYVVNIHRARPVVVTDGVTKKYIASASYDSYTIVEAAGYPIYDGDEISIKEDATLFLETGVTTTYVLQHKNQGESEAKDPASGTKKPSTSTTDSSKPAGISELTTDASKNEPNKQPVAPKPTSTQVVSKPASSQTVSKIPASWENCAYWARQAGVSEDDLQVALTLIYKESNCRVGATNSSSGAYGIPQALPGSKMASAGADWQTNPVTQIRWMIGYVTKRYGGWNQAWAFWQAHHWY